MKKKLQDEKLLIADELQDEKKMMIKKKIYKIKNYKMNRIIV